MKKLNLNNQDLGDDAALISLLKTSLNQEPSKDFVDNTLLKLRTLDERPKLVSKPIITPLIIMIVLGLFLVFPLIWISGDLEWVKGIFAEINGLIVGINQSIDPWYLISPIIIFLALEGLILLEIRITNSRNMIH